MLDIDSLDSLKTDLVVTATYSDSTTATVTAYTLSGTLTAGTSTITVSYSGKTTTFNVTVTETQSVTASPVVMYPSNSLASWNSTTETGEMHETSNTAGWTNLVLQGLQFKRSDVATKTMRIDVTLETSGIPSDTTSHGVMIASGLYTTANPTNSGNQRAANYPFPDVKGNGTFNISVSEAVATMFSDTSLNNDYLGLSIFLNQKTPAAVTISNLRAVVY